MSETQPGETTGSSQIASLNKDAETLDKIVKLVEKDHKSEGEVLSKRLANLKRAIDSLKPGRSPVEAYRTIRTAVSAALQEFAKEAKALAKPKEAPKEVTDVVTFSATTEGAKELNNDKDAKMIQAVKNALSDTGGRAGPKIKGISKPFFHIHVGGNAKNNLLYRGEIMLGTIDFHIEKSNNEQQQAAVKQVANRTGSIDMKIEKGVIAKA